MNLQQLEYIVAVDEHRHFAKAAASCFVTQATLSMMIKKLEEELDVIIFDRSKQPVVPTDIGRKLIAQARLTLREADRLQQTVLDEKKLLQGELRIGVIPTLGPYLLPMFISEFLDQYPGINVKIYELTTSEIMQRLSLQQLDAGLLATPLKNPELREEVIFYEQFAAYASKSEPLTRKKFILPRDIDPDRLWLLEEGHCLRAQVLNLCELRKHSSARIEFEAGSLETLKRMVDALGGVTILPLLAVKSLSAPERRKVRYFKPPYPVREISLVTYRHFIKRRLLDALVQSIRSNVPAGMQAPAGKRITEPLSA